MTPIKVKMLPEDQEVLLVLEHVALVKAAPKKENSIVALTNGVVLHIAKSEQAMHDLLSRTR